MSPSKLDDLKVSLILENGEDALPERNITFKASSGSLQVGRASKTERKQLVPTPNNLWISNPVISRYHAVLSVESDLETSPRVFLEDHASSHGTFVNHVNIKNIGKKMLKNGDLIQFGDKVSRGQDEFGPPSYKVYFEHVLDEPSPRAPSIGRSISVPDDVSDDSEMDESDSDVESTGSHSSPPHWGEEKIAEASTIPGSSGNPFTVDDEPTAQHEVIDLATREPSEEYEPLPEIHCDGGYSPDGQVNDDFDVEMPVYDAPEFEELPSDDEDVPVAATQSPVYTPTSPQWIPPSHEEFVPQHSMQLPSAVEMLKMGVPQPICNNVYFDGPFAQADVYSGEASFAHPTQWGFPTATNIGQDIVESVASQVEEERIGWSTSVPSLSMPAVQAQHDAPSVTVTTQELLEQSRAQVTKNDMSIRSIINHTTVAGKKRKADEISEDDPEPEVEAASGSVDATTGGIILNEVIVHKTVEATKAPSKVPAVPTQQEGRPYKRLRSVASHVGAFVLGSVAVVGGLMSLPDNYFG